MDPNLQTPSPMGPTTNQQNPIQPPSGMPTMTPPVSPYNQNKSHKTLILSLIGGGIALLVAIFMFFILAIYPSIQSRAVAVSFMQNVTSGNVDAAIKLTDGDQSNKSFIETVSQKLKDNSYEIKEDEYNNKGESYYLFSLNGGTQKSARVVIEKSSENQFVKAFVISTSDSMTLKPGSVQQETTPTEPRTDTSSVSSDKCFAASDYKQALGYNNSYVTESNPYLSNVHFLPDSLDYSDSSQAGYVKSFAQIATTNPGKDYSVKIHGSVATTSSADLAFSNQRADKIKQALVAEGMSADKIEIQAPDNISSMGSSNDSTSMQTARVVVMQFYPGCSTTTTQSQK